MTANATCPRTEQLPGLVDRTHSDDLQTELEQHVDECEICLRSLKSLVSGDVALSFLAEAPQQSAPQDDAFLDAIERMKSNQPCDETVAGFPITDCSLDFLNPSDDPNSIGRLGPYEISEMIGRGGMGIVLKGHDAKLNRVVAVKILAPESASNVTARKRFLRESQAAAAVGHPHVVTIHAVDEHRLPYLVMEYVNGQSLQDKIDREGALELKQILRIASQAATGLAAAHEQGLVHRDIKPANILLENGVERVKLTDFGLARAIDDVAITRTGDVAGTPQYMSPEQADGQEIDHRTDLFSLGSVLYAMCTGRPPFRAETSLGVMRRVCDDTPRPVNEVNAEIPGWLANLVARLLCKNPDERFQSASDLADLLNQCLAHVQQPSANPAPPELENFYRAKKRPVLRRRWLTAAAALLVAVAGLGLADAGGLTKITSTIIRVVRGDGTMVIKVDDPQIQVSIDGDELVFSGAGPKEIRFRPGDYDVVATKDGATVHSQRVTITRGGETLVEVTRESSASGRMVSHGPTNRRVWKEAKDWTFSGKPCPDGRYLTYVDWDSGNLGIHDFKENQDRLLTNVGWPQQAWNSVFSPDGQRIAYAWHAEGRSSELRVIGVDASEPRTLYNKGDWIIPTAWSPNGEWISAYVDLSEQYHDVALVSARDGSLRTLAAYQGTQRPWMSFSPDSRYLACTFNQEEDLERGLSNGDVFVLATDGSGKFSVVEHPANDFAIGWTKDGSQLLFASDRTGTNYIYALEIDDGRPQGAPEPITQIGDFAPIGFANNGTYYYGRNVPGQNIFTASIDMDTGTVLKQPERAMLLHEGRQSTPEWSSDGQYLACRADLGGKAGLLVRSMQDGEIRKVSPAGTTGVNYHFLRWSPDGKSVMAAGTHHGKRGLLQINVKSGDVTILAEGRVFDCDWSPDGKTVYYELRELRDDAELWKLVRRDLGSGVETELYSSGRIERLTVSPIGKQLAFLKSGINVMSVDGGEPRILLKKKGISNRSLAWSPDGRYLLFVMGDEQRSELWRIAVDGGEPESVGFSVAGSMIRHLCVHPDGKQIAYRHVADKTQAWVFENLLPPE